MGKMQREKGARFEREVASRFKAAGWPNARRGLAQARSARETPDVDGTEWWVECKHGRQVRIPAAFRQASEATDGRPAVVVSRDNHGDVLVTVSLRTFLGLLVSERLVGRRSGDRA